MFTNPLAAVNCRTGCEWERHITLIRKQYYKTWPSQYCDHRPVGQIVCSQNIYLDVRWISFFLHYSPKDSCMTTRDASGCSVQTNLSWLVECGKTFRARINFKIRNCLCWEVVYGKLALSSKRQLLLPKYQLNTNLEDVQNNELQNFPN